MSTVQAPTRNAADVLEAVTALAPSIAGRAEEIEQGRRLPADLLDELKGTGAFRMLLPTSHGGLGVELPEALRVLETLSAADGSTGWTVMIGSGAWLDLTGLPRATFDALYADGPDVIVAGAINPSGVIEAVDGGYRVTGRWGFASGCEHADWLFGDCVEQVDGRPGGRTARPSSASRSSRPTRSSSRTRGTSPDCAGRAATTSTSTTSSWLPERTHPPLEEEHCIDEPIVRIPAPSLLPCVVASVAIGIAQGALDDIVALATDKVPLLDAAPLAEEPDVPARPGDGRHGAPCRQVAPPRHRRFPLVGRCRRRATDPAAAGARPGRRGVGHGAGGRRRRRRLQGGRWQLALHGLAAPAPAAGRPRRDAALPGQAGCDDGRGRDPRRQRHRPAPLLRRRSRLRESTRRGRSPCHDWHRTRRRARHPLQ